MTRRIRRTTRGKRTSALRAQRIVQRSLELLEERLPLAGGWQNPFNNIDVNFDGLVTPNDGLVQINELQRKSTIGDGGRLPTRSEHVSKPFWDTDGDDFLAPGDVLRVFNGLNKPLTPVIEAALVADTSAGGGMNSDRITSNPLISGTVRGKVGVQFFTATIDSGSPIPIVPDVTGAFAFRPDFPDGAHTIQFNAADGYRNSAPPVEVAFSLDTIAPVIHVSSPVREGTIHANSRVTVTVTGDTAAATIVSYQLDGGALVSVPFDPQLGAFDRGIDVSGLTEGVHRLTVVATDAAGNTSGEQLDVSFQRMQVASFHVSHFTPRRDASEIGATFPPQVFFSEPADISTLTAENFFASVNGQKLAAKIVPANDGTFAWLYLAETMPGATRVTVTVDGATIRSQEGKPLDASASGTPGSKLSYSFVTVSLTPLLGTRLTGIIVDPGPDLKPRTADDFDAGPDGKPHTNDDRFLLPIAGVEVFIIGLKKDKVVTGADGRFAFDAVPAGNVKVVIDGLTATRPPSGMYFPEMVMDANMAVAQNNFVMAGMEGAYLPRLATSILKPISAAETSLLVSDADSAPDLTTEQRQLLTLEIPPQSLIAPDGTKLASARIGISSVPEELVRDMLPPGVLQHAFDITIQALGVANFSTPATLSVPNLSNQPPGTKLSFLSFDHTTGRLVIEGTATVSADGRSVVTDPGTGITRPGWHGVINDPGSEVIGDPQKCTTSEHDLEVEPLVTFGIEQDDSEDVAIPTSRLLVDDDGDFTLVFENHAKLPDGQSDECSTTNVRATTARVKITVEGPADKFLAGIRTQSFTLPPEKRVEIEVTIQDLLADVASKSQDELYGAKVSVEITKTPGKPDGDQPGGSQVPDPPLVEQDFYLYRFVDTGDSDHTDGVVEFADTTVDAGPTNIVRHRKLMTDFGKEPPTLVLQDPLASNFSANFTGFGFDPRSKAQDLTAAVNVLDPDGNVAGTLQLKGDGERMAVVYDGLKLLEALHRLSLPVGVDPLGLPGASAEEVALLDDPAERDAIVNLIIERIKELTSGHTTPGIDGQRHTFDDGGIIFVDLNDLDPSPLLPAVSATVFTSDRTQFGGIVPATRLGESDLIDLSYTSVLSVVRNNLGLNSIEKGFRLSEALNEQPAGNIEVYVDNILAAAKFTTQQQIANAIAKTLLHESGHQAGLVHTSTNFDANDAIIFGRKFHDLDADGQRDGQDEPGLGGATIILQDANGEEIARTKTDGFGKYQFTDLAAGFYTVEELPRIGWMASTLVEFQVQVNQGERFEVPDIGNFRMATISGVKYFDRNGNGTRNLGAGEVALAGWTIKLVDKNGVIQAVQTDNQGQFEFRVNPGTYRIIDEIPPPAAFAGDWGTRNPTETIETVDSGELDANISFGNYRLRDIRGTVYNDINGSRAIGAPPDIAMPGVTVSLTGPFGLMTAVTDANGLYQFLDQPPGTYQVRQTVPPGFVQIIPSTFSHKVKLDFDHTKPDDQIPTYHFLNGGVAGEGLDFGDAPDAVGSPRYPTLAVHVGAAHQPGGGLHLGAGVGFESDGQPNATATGDSDDGVTLPESLLPGQPATVIVTASAAGLLDAFVDFNADGDWDDAGEQVFNGQALTAGANSLGFTVPATATPGATTFARFRLSSAGGLPPTGVAADGEVEDYQVSIGTADFDLGDAPDDRYPTRLTQDGARHIVQSGFHLGAAIDIEPDGQPNGTATGDGADEDGVTFTSPLVPGASATIRVVASAPGKLDTFIDFNNDGDWIDAGEQVFVSASLVAVNNNLTFTVPLSTAPSSTLFARFRFSSTGGLTATGGAADGEVEDYAINIAGVALDYGDARDPYPTLLANDGARHIVTGVFLGAAITGEADGQPNENALSDADDGVVFAGPIRPGSTADVVVTAAAPGKLDAWIDFDGSGDWLASDEQIFRSVDLLPGQNVLSFEVPIVGDEGLTTTARFRFSTAGSLAPIGLAADGEVEDYVVQTTVSDRGIGDESGARPVVKIANPGADLDIMAQGVDIHGELAFRPLGLTQEALRIALGLDWSKIAVQNAVSYYSKYLVASRQNPNFFDDTVRPGNPVPPIGTGILFVTSNSTGSAVFDHDFGYVEVVGGQSAAVSETFVLHNFGDQPLTLDGVRLADGAPSGYMIAGPPNGTVLSPGQISLVTVTFAPTATGLHETSLVIDLAGNADPVILPITGFGLSLLSDIEVHIAQSNLGEAVVGGESVIQGEFATIRNIGASDLIIGDIRLDAIGANHYQLGGLPAGLGADESIVLGPGETFSFDLTFAPTSRGLQRGVIEIVSSDPDSLVFKQPVVGTGLSSEPAVIGGNYVAVATPTIPDSPIFRDKTDDGGRFAFFLPASTPIRYVIFDPVSNLIAQQFLVTRPSGEQTLLSAPVFIPDTSPDDDGDGLPNDTEFAIGTRPDNSDTNRDGISDFDALRGGIDPLAGFTAATGLIGLLPLGHPGNDVVVAASSADPNRLLAYIATGDASGGLAIADVTNPNAPLMLSQLTLPSFGQAPSIAFGVTVDAARDIAAVSTQFQTHLVDVSDPTAPRITQTLDVRGITFFDGFAYFAQGTMLVSMDLETGERRDDLPRANEGFTDLERAGNFLYVMTGVRAGQGRLRIFELAADHSGRMIERGEIQVAGTSGRIFVDNGVAYLMTTEGVFGPFITVDVSDPDNPKRLSEEGPGFTLPRTAVATNSSRFGYLIGRNLIAPFNPQLSVVDVTDPAANTQQVTSFTLPEQARGLSIGGGRVHVAVGTDPISPVSARGTGGLHIFNFPSFDTAGQPPTVSLTTPFDDDSSTPGVQLIEGSTIPFFATVTDDVQMRNVELLLGGRVVANDVNAPFEFDIALPSINGVNSVNLQARAFDTGGNAALSDALTVHLIRDNQPPRITLLEPVDGGFRPEGGVKVRVGFNEELAAASLAATRFTLRDGTGGVLSPNSVNFTPREVSLLFDTLAAGEYELTIDGPNVKDLAGNPLSSGSVISRFTVDSGTVFWTKPGDGSWQVPGNWSTGQVPGPTDNVVIGVDGPITVTVDRIQARAAVNSLRSEELIIADAGLILGGPSQLIGGLQLQSNADLGLLTFNADTVLGGQSLLGAEINGTGTLTNRGTLTFIDGEFSRIKVPLVNESLVRVDTATVDFFSTIMNEGTWEFRGGALIGGPSAGQFTNLGNVTLTSPLAEVTIAMPFHSSGQPITIPHGSKLTLSKGGTSNNLKVQVEERAEFVIAGGTFDWIGDTELSGDGVVVLERGVVKVPAGSVATFHLTGDTLMLGPGNSFDLVVEGTVINTGHAIWQGADILVGASPAVFRNEGVLDIDSNLGSRLTGAFENLGDVTQRLTGSITLDQATITNRANASWDFQGNGILDDRPVANSRFINLGTIRRTTSSQVMTLDVPFDNRNRVSVESGELRATRGGTHADSKIEVAAGGVFSFALGDHVLTGTSAFTGDGLVEITGGTVTIPAGSNTVFNMPTGGFTIRPSSATDGLQVLGSAVNRGRMHFRSGEIDAAGTFTNDGTAQWTSGTFRGAGEIVNNGTLDIPAGTFGGTLSATLKNRGTVNHASDRSLTFVNGTFVNETSGLYNLQAAGGFAAGFGSATQRFENLGTLRRGGAAATITLDVGFQNAGLVELLAGTTVFADGYAQTAGTSALAGGNLSVNALLVDLQGGTLRGSGLITGNVTNAATIEVGGVNQAGTLTITRNYAQTTSGAVNIELGGPASGAFDQLVLNSTSGAQTTTLAGTLNVSVLGGASIAAADRFEVLKFDSVTGDFATTNGLDIGGGLVLVKTVAGTNVALTAAAALHADRAALPATPAVAPLTPDLLQPLWSAVFDRFVAGGLTAEATDTLRQTEIVILDLAGSALGAFDGTRILLDVNAAGYGWFIDATPDHDEAIRGLPFPLGEGRGEGNGAVADRMDLLTVLAHELGHVLGWGHDEHDLMQAIVSVGESHLLFTTAADEVFAELE